MGDFLKKHGGRLRNICVPVMLVVPFFLYHAALGGSVALVYFLLGIMGVTMLAAMKIG